MQRSEPPSSLADEPLGVARRWLAEAEAAGVYRNPGAMALATTDEAGKPAVRMVLLKRLAAEGYAVFYTNYESRKGRELARNARAAGVLYWERLGRQLRLEGLAVRSPAAESDAYFASRPLGSRINAAISEQSRPTADPAEVDARMSALRAQLEASGGDCPRPPDWGGYRLWLDRIEFWTEGEDRCHRRLVYARRLAPDEGGYAGGPWTHTWLQP